jgi:tRNA (mo5U34)-methyltransferase
MEDAELQELSSKISWWHQIRLTPNFVTKGMTDPIIMLTNSDSLSLVKGKRVLDIGAWDGGLSFEAERRGASEVVALDTWDWGFDWKLRGDWKLHDLGPGLTPSKAGFDLAHEALDSKVQAVQMNIIDATPQELGTFDIVFFCGVLYHLKHPLLALESIRALCRDLLVVETHIGLPDDPRPISMFYPGCELNNDPTNWWGPNVECVKAWLRTSGFPFVEYRGGNPRGTFHAHI